MKKTTAVLLAFILVLALAGCASEDNDTVQLDKLISVPLATLEANLIGISREDIHEAWGDADGMLSGLYGDIWLIPDSDQQIILYYDEEGLISAIKIIDQIQDK